LRRKPESRKFDERTGSRLAPGRRLCAYINAYVEIDSERFSAASGYFHPVIPAQAGIQLFSPAA
jgi:hypothetical protein